MSQTKAQLLGPVVGDVTMDVSTLSLDSEGNKVGIGTTGATATLHVFEPTEGDAVVQFNSGDNFPTVNRGLVIKSATGPTGYTGSKWIFDAQSSGGRIEFQTTSTPRLTILESGNIGIGTDNPSASLDVVADAASGYVAEFRQAHVSNTAQIIIDSPTDAASRPSYMDYATGGTVKWRTGLAYLDANRSFHIGTGSIPANSKLTIKPTGEVGIGTNDPISELMVENATQSHITVKTSDSNMAKFGSKGNDVYIGGTAGAANIIFKRNIVSTDHPADSGTETLRITNAGQLNINASSESIGGRVVIKNNVDYTTTDFDDNPTLYLLNGDQTTGISEAAIILAGRNTSGSTFRAAISGNGSSGIKFHPSSDAEQDHTPAMLINNSNRIGINVTSPEDPLHVKNSSANPTSIRIQTGTSSTNNGDEYSSIVFDGNGYVGAKIASHRDDATWNDRGDLRFYSGYGNNVFTERMRISNTGELSISGSRSGNNISDAILKFNIVNSNGDGKKAEIKAIKLLILLVN